jgi:hypothetical protein
LPVDYGVPEQALVAAVEVAVEWIEIEGDYVALSYGKIQDCGAADEI